MIDACKNKAEQLNLSNVKVINENISAKASTVLLNYKAKVDYVTLFNILHCEKPHKLLKTTHELLADNGKVGILHWIHEDTPRGPSLNIRPKPEQIINWANEEGFSLIKQVNLPPYHYGLLFIKKAN